MRVCADEGTEIVVLNRVLVPGVQVAQRPTNAILESATHDSMNFRHFSLPSLLFIISSSSFLILS